MAFGPSENEYIQEHGCFFNLLYVVAVSCGELWTLSSFSGSRKTNEERQMLGYVVWQSRRKIMLEYSVFAKLQRDAVQTDKSIRTKFSWEKGQQPDSFLKSNISSIEWGEFVFAKNSSYLLIKPRKGELYLLLKHTWFSAVWLWVDCNPDMFVRFLFFLKGGIFS